VLVWTEVPDPEPGPGEVLIDITASAVNRADLLQRAGAYPPPPGAPPYPGLECSGRIAALGEGVTGHSVGDEGVRPPRRWRLRRAGRDHRRTAPAESRATSASPTPPDCPRSPARSGPTSSPSPASNPNESPPDPRRRQRHRHVRHPAGEGERRHRGHDRRGRPSTTRSNRLGRDATIDYSTEDFVEATMDGHQAASGADVILDIMGAAYLQRNVDALARGGRLVIIGMQGGATGEVNLGALMGQAGEHRGHWPPFPAAGREGRDHSGSTEQVWPHIESGAIKPVVHTRMPMAEAAAAPRARSPATNTWARCLVN
jgi:NADPH:quinone reductase-like Zn-dependent oxidoreductase